MLKMLRNKKTAKKVWIGLAVIIIPAFTFWGFGGSFKDKEDNKPIGKIAGRNITDLEFKEALEGVRTSAIIQFGEKLAELEKFLNLPAQAWERLLLLNEAKLRKIEASDKEVIELIQNTPFFQDKGGFNNKLYEENVRYTFRVGTRTFEEQMRQNLILSKLYRQITADIKLSGEEIRNEYLKIEEELSIDYISSLYSDFEKKVKPTDKEISEYFEKNKQLFKEPTGPDNQPYIPELAKIKNKVKEAFIKEAAQRAAENKIKECVEKIKSLKLKDATACGLKSGSTGFFKSSGQIKELGDANLFWNEAKRLKPDEKSGILSNDKGYYIISLKSVKPLDEKAYEKDKAEFGERLIASKKNQAFADFARELEKKSR